MSKEPSSYTCTPRGDCKASAQAAGASAATAEATAPQVLGGKTAAVIGGGPAGVLCAAHLARLGAQVTVYERHVEDPARKAPGWNIVLGGIAGKSIAAAGLNPDFPPHLRANGSSQHTAGKPPRAAGAAVLSQSVCTTSRDEITAHLTAETLRVHGGRVEFRAGVSLVGGAVSRGELELEVAGGGRERHRVDVVVGADGVHSDTRRLLCEQDASMAADVHGCAVKTLTTSVSSQGNPVSYGDLPTLNGQRYDAFPEPDTDPIPGTLTSFFFPAAGPLGVNFLIVNSRRGGEDVTIGITAAATWWAERGDEGAVRAAFQRWFPHFPTVWLEECVRAAVDAPPEAPRQSAFVTCSKLGSGRAVLVGDAAHAMSANLGMGCNTALLDCAALADAAVATGGNLDALAARFTHAHQPDVRAVSRISRGVYDVSFRKHHGRWLHALAGIPMFAWWSASFVAPKLPGVLQPLLKPRRSGFELYGGTVPMRALEADARAFSARLAATAAAVLVGSAAVLWRLGALVS